MADPRPPDATSTPAHRQDLHPERESEVHEAVALFTDPEALEHAVEDLLTNGFDHADITVLARDRVVRDRLGHRLDDTASLADNPIAPRSTPIDPASRTEGRSALASMLGYVGAITALGLTFATGGAAAVAIGAALVGAGGGAALGAGLGKLIDQRRADELARQVEAGGIVLWVRCRDKPCRRDAERILAQHGAHHIHGIGEA